MCSISSVDELCTDHKGVGSSEEGEGDEREPKTMPSVTEVHAALFYAHNIDEHDDEVFLTWNWHCLITNVMFQLIITYFFVKKEIEISEHRYSKITFFIIFVSISRKCIIFAFCFLMSTWSDKVREPIVVKVLHTSLLNITVVAFKVFPLGSYAPMPAPNPPFKIILELVLWNALQSCHRITPDVISAIKIPSFKYYLYLWEQKRVTGG
jgi:hypothetical protein